MTESIKPSAFPPLLKIYNPSYEPAIQVRKTVHGMENRDDNRTERKQPRSPCKTGNQPRGHTTAQQQKDQEKRLRKFERWQEVKSDMNDERTDQLKKKIGLQLRLIHARDEAYRQKVERENEEQRQAREQQRQHQRDQAQLLLNVCRESLEIDQKNKRKLLVKPLATDSQPTPSYDTVGIPGLSTNTTAMLDDPDDGTTPVQVSPYHLKPYKSESFMSEDSNLSESASPVKQPTLDIAREFTVASTLTELTEGSSRGHTRENTVVSITEEDEIPKHHEMLYRLYGRQVADYFLYPKVDKEKKIKASNLRQRLKIDTDRARVQEIWSGLRSETEQKLIKVDESFKPELKEQIILYRKKVLQQAAFSSYLREGLDQDWTTVTRSFCATEDVPELPLLQDRSRIDNAQRSRHKVQVMKRLSNINQDKFKVLLHNNPIPDLNNWSGDESVARYLPSWDEDQQMAQLALGDAPNTTEDPTNQITTPHKELQPLAITRSNFKDHLENLPKYPMATTLGPRQTTDLTQKSKLTGKTKATSSAARQEYETTVFSGTGDEWDLRQLDDLLPDEKPGKGVGYTFLTEADATVPGEFRKRMAEQNVSEQKNGLHKGLYAPASAMARIGGQEPDQLQNDNVSNTRSQSQTAISETPIMLWEPLTMKALSDYKVYKQAIAYGFITQGQKPLGKWAVNV